MNASTLEFATPKSAAMASKRKLSAGCCIHIEWRYLIWLEEQSLWATFHYSSPNASRFVSIRTLSISCVQSYCTFSQHWAESGHGGGEGYAQTTPITSDARIHNDSGLRLGYSLTSICPTSSQTLLIALIDTESSWRPSQTVRCRRHLQHPSSAVHRARMKIMIGARMRKNAALLCHSTNNLRLLEKLPSVRWNRLLRSLIISSE